VCRVLCIAFGSTSVVRLFHAALDRCSWGHLLNAKGDSLDLMWPSGPHLTFGLLALLALIDIFNARRLALVCET
jgi:hypothetical protein